MPVSTECVAALLSFRYPSLIIIPGHNFLGTTLPSPCLTSSQIFLVWLNALWQQVGDLIIDLKFIGHKK